MSVKPTIVELILNATAAGKSMLSAANAAAQKTLLSLVKGDVGLGNVDNTSDANKPVSTAQQTALDAKADLVGGVVPSAQIPAIAITEYLGSVANQSAMLALDGDRGDWCLRSDTGTTFVLSDDDSTLLASWVELNYPTAPVTSVNGETGAVTLSASDVGAAATSHTHAQSDVTGLVSDLSGKQATLVSGTNIKTINSTSLLGSGDISVGGVGGSAGSTDNRVLRADGTGGATVQNSAVTIDDSGNVTGIVSEVISRGTNAGNAALTVGGSGGGTTRINDNGTVLINADVGSGSNPFTVQYNSTQILQLTYQGVLTLPALGQVVNLGSGVMHVTAATGNRSLLKSYVNLELCPGSLGGGGTYVEINSGTAGTYRDLKLRDMTASGLVCAGTYTVGTLPSAGANAYKFATVSDSSVTTFGSTVAGGGSSKVQVFSNGTNWTVCAA